MNILDIALIISALIAFLYGYSKGFVKQLSFGIGVIFGLFQAILFYPTVAAWIKSYTQWSDIFTVPLAFIAILICTVLIFKIFSIIISRILDFCHLSFVDKILGAGFSIFIGLFIFVGVVTLINKFTPENRFTGKTAQNNSLLYRHTKILTSLIIGEAEKNI